MGEALVLELWEVWSTSSLPLLSGPLWPGVVVLVGVQSMGQIDSFENDSYWTGICEIITVQTNNYYD